MTATSFTRGVGVGLVVGSVIAMTALAIPTDKHHHHISKKSPVGRALHTVGNIVDNITDSIGM
ncbi:MAG: hypothetical protein LBM18_06535 [Oscillospiraceae bacterium]|jgi:hypothetical protein|nr:hypothetical protein [Oscillospiraceae bacterium]